MFSYLCKAPLAICSEAERSASLSTKNGSRVPTRIDHRGICDEMCLATSNQAVDHMGSIVQYCICVLYSRGRVRVGGCVDLTGGGAPG